ncbi:MAG: hypothetical protein ABJA34_09500 [Pseudonocardiales bacterium]
MRARKPLRRRLFPHLSTRRTTVVAAAIAAVIVAALAGPAVAGGTSAPYCGITWGSTAKSGGTLSPGSLLAVRTGQHSCFDRVVFDFTGPASGYRVNYASEVYTQAGQPMRSHTAGGALLDVTLLENANTYPRTTFAHVADVAGYRTLRDVVYGGTFEGYTTFAVGVRARLPMRVFVLAGPESHTRVVVDVAHAWTQ